MYNQSCERMKLAVLKVQTSSCEHFENFFLHLGKNFVKATFLQKKIVRSWFDGKFFCMNSFLFRLPFSSPLN